MSWLTYLFGCMPGASQPQQSAVASTQQNIANTSAQMSALTGAQLAQLASLQNAASYKVRPFASYQMRIVPALLDAGYRYFLSCQSDEFVAQEEWCRDNCDDYTVGHCDAFPIGAKYPRAFKSKADVRAVMCVSLSVGCGCRSQVFIKGRHFGCTPGHQVNNRAKSCQCGMPFTFALDEPCR